MCGPDAHIKFVGTRLHDEARGRDTEFMGNAGGRSGASLNIQQENVDETSLNSTSASRDVLSCQSRPPSAPLDVLLPLLRVAVERR